MGEREIEVLEWLRGMPGPMRSSLSGWEDCARELCRRGLARCVFVRGEFYYTAKEPTK